MVPFLEVGMKRGLSSEIISQRQEMIRTGKGVT